MEKRHWSIHNRFSSLLSPRLPGSNEKRNLNNNKLSEAGLWDIGSRGNSGLTLHVFSVQQHIIQKIDQKP